MEFTAEILCLGNELLIGRTINKNATEMALALTKIGIKVLRETTVRDDLKQAVEVLQEIVQRNPNIILITGGLGPTHDDIQLEIISKAFSMDLELNAAAVKMMKLRYNLSEENFSRSMEKMAMLPVGSIALPNSQGAAPGVETKKEDIFIYSLPGVPREMNAILNEEIIPRISNQFNSDDRMIEYGFNLRGVGESRIIDITENVRAKYPEIGFKSHPKNDETGYWLALHTYKIGDEEKIVKDACQMWYNELKKAFKVELSNIESIFSEGFEPE
ncbi:MAG: competence/damage-inducible protein A [Candidatus Heimdallarchaeota archaeon]|nr:competence/damage-inducible protein A [Candidatus Heimdallarchaeota archaeon]